VGLAALKTKLISRKIYPQMKKTLIFSTILVSFSLILFSCQKNEDAHPEDFVIPMNKEVVLTKPNGVKITASDVYSRKNTFRREIKINAGENNTQLSPIYMTFVSDSDDNIYEKMKSHPYSVNGEFTIETEGQVILRKKVVNGVWKKSELIAFQVSSAPGPKSNPKVPCSVGTVHDCVAWEIDDMNWIEYGLCLASAPGCYGGLWASCAWEVCHNHMQYTNPN